jgi:sulfide:quinone oxidoreductase
MAGPVLCVVGAGTAGLEGLLCARDRLGPDAELRLIAPNREFRYRPTSPDSLFRPARERGIAIDKVVAMARAEWVADCAEVVHPAERFLLTRDGDTVGFDFLLLAAGARPRRSLRQGYVWERGQDPRFLDEIVLDLSDGKARTLAVVVPRGARWPLPAYELALVAAWSVAGTGARVTLITAEQRPLGALGRSATEAVTHELAAAGVETISGVEVVDEREEVVSRSGPPVMLVPERPATEDDALIGRPTDPAHLRFGNVTNRRFDWVVALPTMVGPLIAGVPTDAAGFIEVDQSLKVWRDEPVWAAGGCIATGLEHSALSAQQADAAIAAIAAASTGGPGAGPADVPELSGVLLTDQRERWLRENPPGTPEPSTRCLWWPSGRAVGRMLAARIDALDPSVTNSVPPVPEGVTIRAPVVLGSQAPAAPTASELTGSVREARQHDVENRQLRAVERREHEANAELRDLSAGLQTLAVRQQAVIQSLRRHGYLRDRGQNDHRRGAR